MKSGAILVSGLVTKKLALSEVQIMAIRKALGGGEFVESRPKKSRQGMGKHTKLSATSHNGKRKRYRGQGNK